MPRPQLEALTDLFLWRCWELQGSTLGQLSAIRGLVSLSLSECPLTTLKGLELLPALQEVSVPDVEAAELARLTALTTLTRLDTDSNITDECSALLRLPSLASLYVNSISLAAADACHPDSVLQRLTSLEASWIGTMSRLLPLAQLKCLSIDDMKVNSDQDGGDEDAAEAAALAAAISRQTSLTFLELWGGLSAQQMVQMVAPLKQLQSFTFCFAPADTSCLAACAALAELPLQQVPAPAHLCMLVRCAQLGSLQVAWQKGADGASTGLLAALLCKPGLRLLRVLHGGAALCDKELLAQVAARAGVHLMLY